MTNVSIVIPAYNEEKRIGRLLTSLQKIPKENIRYSRQTPLSDALIDVLICVKATHFKGSGWSSFSGLIDILRDIGAYNSIG